MILFFATTGATLWQSELKNGREREKQRTQSDSFACSCVTLQSVFTYFARSSFCKDSGTFYHSGKDLFQNLSLCPSGEPSFHCKKHSAASSRHAVLMSSIWQTANAPLSFPLATGHLLTAAIVGGKGWRRGILPHVLSFQLVCQRWCFFQHVNNSPNGLEGLWDASSKMFSARVMYTWVAKCRNVTSRMKLHWWANGKVSLHNTALSSVE